MWTKERSTNYQTLRISSFHCDVTQITSSIVLDVNISPYFGFVANEATNVSTTDQIAMVLYVSDKGKGAEIEDSVGV